MVISKEEWNNALINRIGKVLHNVYAKSTVAICGLGGLGSNIANILARSGIGKLILIDYDKVDITNIHRQQYKISQINKLKTTALKENLLEIAPYLEIEIHSVAITENNVKELLEKADIICEAFDKPEEKAMLVNTVMERMPNKYIVAASGMAGLNSPNSIQTRMVTKHFYISGDGVSDIGDGIEIMASGVTLCAAHQAHTVLRILANI